MYLTSKELQEKLKISLATVDRLIKKGMPVLKVGGQKRFIEKEVLEWLRNRQGEKK